LPRDGTASETPASGAIHIVRRLAIICRLEAQVGVQANGHKVLLGGSVGKSQSSGVALGAGKGKARNQGGQQQVLGIGVDTPATGVEAAAQEVFSLFALPPNLRAATGTFEALDG
jgi:hypothetical protein